MTERSPRPTGYMDKERAESERRRKEYLEWLKRSQAESKARRKAFVASTREYSATLGKYDSPEYKEHIKKYKELRSKDGFGKQEELPLDKKTQG
ncbi:MAG: hypothetical protein SCARUB_00542 [Candidatus Scalindua rubra]|uniref:Uncharacterized protein n=1 Tax=Candidatus Scalindua rubra TaxID=1872076 RepID=A0A1E3XF75_9BACT|nr:MAG: hypothetical protein SCARUB_00542 [Candidatus Scalindua rubra]